VVSIEAAVGLENGCYALKKARFVRTARRIMDGVVYVRRSVLT